MIRRIAATVILSVIVPAQAHHSFAMFDAEKTVAIAGIVLEFRWENPHCWIVLAADDGRRWAVEMSHTSMLRRQGWSYETLMPGIRIRVVVHPLREAGSVGHFVSVTLPDGTVIGETDPGGKLPAEVPYPHP